MRESGRQERRKTGRERESGNADETLEGGRRKLARQAARWHGHASMCLCQCQASLRRMHTDALSYQAGTASHSCVRGARWAMPRWAVEQTHALKRSRNPAKSKSGLASLVQSSTLPAAAVCVAAISTLGPKD